MNAISLLAFLLFTLCFPSLGLSKYELEPFKLKELPPQKEKKDPLETMRVQSSLNEEVKPKRNYGRRLSLRGGYPFIFGDLGGVSKASLPYVSLALRDQLSGPKVLYELDISYFSFKNDGSVFTFINSIPVQTESQSHAFPVTFSVLYRLSLSKAVSLNPKIGLGYMLTYTTSTNGGNGFSSFLIGKPGLEIEFRLSRSASIILENTLLVAAEAKDFDLTFFYIPNVGVSFRF